ncbi:tRNA-specific 2-thiouridylase MnmA [Planctomycetota bacterium]|nr:tRNA-specific 2-thiouridylase MnmA [Planctomycetota bacterium]
MRIVCGMSGGVDSSLAACLLQEAGHEVVGITMKLWPCAEEDGGFTRPDACCSPTETIDARGVAVGRGVRHYVLDLEREFATAVVQRFTDEYARGRTPNPCIRCNEDIKFGQLWTHARRLGAERVATGHYARASRFGDRWLLQTAADTDKDQTYFLFSLTQEQLAHAEFPVGHLTKDEVRAESRRRGLATADKPESQDICFVGDSAADFLRRERPDAFRPGPIRHIDGREVGRHDGLPAFTIGQRKGLGVAWNEPLYVVAIDPAENAVVVGERPHLLTDHLALTDCTWHLGQVPTGPIRARLRHRGTLHQATIASGDDGRATIRFAEPVQRTAPGQACVVYDPTARTCLGGGWVA